MRLSPSYLAAALAMALAVPVIGAAQDQPTTPQRFDVGNEVTAYQRFLVYPHLDKGWDAMKRGDRQRAIAEFERAHAIAPESASIALALADAHRRFGDGGRAESVLRSQLTRTPGDVRLRHALTALKPPVPKAPVVAAAPGTSQPAAAVVPTPTPPQVVSAKPPSRRTTAKAAALVAAASPAVVDPRAGFAEAIRNGQFDAAQHEALALLDASQRDSTLLDELSYQLMDAGASAQAATVLMQSYPFASASSQQRESLFGRVAMLVVMKSVAVEDLARLREPLDTPELRSRQATLWAVREDCATVRSVLADMSPDYGYDDWMRLGDCSAQSAPATAALAYSRAHAIEPGGAASRALGYQAYAAGDYRTAFDAWRSVDEGRLPYDDLLGAATTALAAGEAAQAVRWLNAYRARGGTMQHRYWTLTAQALEVHGDTAGAITALQYAINLQPQSDDLLHIARLSAEPARQVTWLEQAATIDSHNSLVHAELAYAYHRVGRSAKAVETFERAAALDPDNMAVQLALGYAYWQLGLPYSAERAFERVWQANPGYIAAAQQLVYVHQRLSHNDRARWYAERVLDAMAASNEPADGTGVAEAANRRFGLRRLHEDLGRRLTVNMDAWSGTQVGTGTGASQTVSGYRSYSQLEADYRIGRPAIRNGSTVSVFARLIADGGDERRALPDQNRTVGLGLRWKPFGSRIFYIAAEQQMSLDTQRGDVLLRTSASLFNGGRHSDDWHASGHGWFSQNLYLDGAHYVREEYSAATADYRTSYHLKLGGSQTFEPYARMQLNGMHIRNVRTVERDTRAGAGIRWNIWYGANRYDAAPHKLTIGLEYQQAFETYLADENGLFLSVGARF